MKKHHYRNGNAGMLAVLALALIVIVGGYFYFKGKAQPTPVEPPAQEAPQPVASIVKRVALALLAQNGSGESGTAVFTDQGGDTHLVLTMQIASDTPAMQPAHIHSGSCQELGSITYPLTTVQSGTSETVLPVSLDALLKQMPLAINVHKSPEEANVYVSCADMKAPVAMDTDTSTKMAGQAPAQDAKIKKLTKATLTTPMKGVSFSYRGDLADVTNGTTFLGVTTQGISSGSARAVFIKGMYRLEATFSDLPDPSGTDFYEGWLVRKADASANAADATTTSFDFISTGKAVKTGKGYLNYYSSAANLTDHLFYVLTLESDDGNPAPSGHVLEGTLGLPQENAAAASTTSSAGQ